MRPSTLHSVPIPSQTIRIMAELLGEHGLDAKPAFAASGLDPAILADPLATVTGAAEIAFAESFMTLTGDRRQLWLELGLRSRFLMMGIFGVAVMSARDVAAALKTAARLAPLHHALSTYDLATSDGICTLTMNLSQVPAHMAEFMVIRDVPPIIDLFNVIWGAPFPFIAVQLSVPRGPDGDIRHDGSVDVRQGPPGARWLWQAGLMGRRLATSNRRLHETYLRQADQLIAGAEARGRSRTDRRDIVTRLREMLGSSDLGLDLADAAQRFGMSERTLQRRLAEQGTSFRAVLNQARMRLARQQLIGTELPIAEIAWRLGYTEVSSFNHSFRGAFGQSPRGFRNAQRALLPGSESLLRTLT